MFGMWEGKVAVVILTGLAHSEEVTTDWCNEMWDIEKGKNKQVRHLNGKVHNFDQRI